MAEQEVHGEDVADLTMCVCGRPMDVCDPVEPFTTDAAFAVVLAASRAVQGLSPQARKRLAAGAYFVRLDAHDARALIAAVDAHDGVSSSPGPISP